MFLDRCLHFPLGVGSLGRPWSEGLGTWNDADDGDRRSDGTDRLSDKPADFLFSFFPTFVFVASCVEVVGYHSVDPKPQKYTPESDFSDKGITASTRQPECTVQYIPHGSRLASLLPELVPRPLRRCPCGLFFLLPLLAFRLLLLLLHLGLFSCRRPRQSAASWPVPTLGRTGTLRTILCCRGCPHQTAQLAAAGTFAKTGLLVSFFSSTAPKQRQESPVPPSRNRATPTAAPVPIPVRYPCRWHGSWCTLKKSSGFIVLTASTIEGAGLAAGASASRALSSSFICSSCSAVGARSKPCAPQGCCRGAILWVARHVCRRLHRGRVPSLLAAPQLEDDDVFDLFFFRLPGRGSAKTRPRWTLCGAHYGVRST